MSIIPTQAHCTARMVALGRPLTALVATFLFAAICNGVDPPAEVPPANAPADGGMAEGGMPADPPPQAEGNAKPGAGRLDLFGNLAEVEADRKKRLDSANVRKVRILLRESMKTSDEIADCQQQMRSTLQQLAAKQKEFRGLKDEFKIKFGQWAAVNAKLNRMSGVVLNIPNHPQRETYSLLKAQAQGLARELNQFKDRKQNLPN